MIRFLTAGESHGPCLVGILEGMPAGLAISEDEITLDLKRRQQGHGRGQRMKIEQDHARILSGIRHGFTLGSPIALLIENRDWSNWQTEMSADRPEHEPAPITTPRPGHADLAGAIKYHHRDLRNVIERSSARETAMRVALGAVCRKFFRELGVTAASHVISIGTVKAEPKTDTMRPDEINCRADESPVRCLDRDAQERMTALIDRAVERGDTVGGVFEVVVDGLPPGIGSHVHCDRRLDAILGGAVLSIQAVKSVEFGLGREAAERYGSEVHDPIIAGESGVRFRHGTNRAGGIEGGMSNGERVWLRAAMKPLPTLGRPLQTVDMATGLPAEALRERSDVCAVPAAAVVAEAMCLIALMNPFLEKIGGDSMAEIQRHLAASPGLPWD